MSNESKVSNQEKLLNFALVYLRNPEDIASEARLMSALKDFLADSFYSNKAASPLVRSKLAPGSAGAEEELLDALCAILKEASTKLEIGPNMDTSPLTRLIPEGVGLTANQINRGVVALMYTINEVSAEKKIQQYIAEGARNPSDLSRSLATVLTSKHIAALAKLELYQVLSTDQNSAEKLASRLEQLEQKLLAGQIRPKVVNAITEILNNNRTPIAEKLAQLDEQLAIPYKSATSANIEEGVADFEATAKLAARKESLEKYLAQVNLQSSYTQFAKELYSSLEGSELTASDEIIKQERERLIQIVESSEDRNARADARNLLCIFDDGDTREAAALAEYDGSSLELLEPQTYEKIGLILQLLDYEIRNRKTLAELISKLEAHANSDDAIIFLPILRDTFKTVTERLGDYHLELKAKEEVNACLKSRKKNNHLVAILSKSDISYTQRLKLFDAEVTAQSQVSARIKRFSQDPAYAKELEILSTNERTAVVRMLEYNEFSSGVRIAKLLAEETESKLVNILNNERQLLSERLNSYLSEKTDLLPTGITEGSRKILIAKLRADNKRTPSERWDDYERELSVQQKISLAAEKLIKKIQALKKNVAAINKENTSILNKHQEFANTIDPELRLVREVCRVATVNEGLIKELEKKLQESDKNMPEDTAVELLISEYLTVENTYHQLKILEDVNAAKEIAIPEKILTKAEAEKVAQKLQNLMPEMVLSAQTLLAVTQKNGNCSCLLALKLGEP